MKVKSGAFVLPGDFLCNVDSSVQIGRGTFIENGEIKSSSVGRLELRDLENQKVLVSVTPREQKFSQPEERISQLSIHDLVLCRVTKIQDTGARVEIMAINDVPSRLKLEGVIKKDNMVPPGTQLGSVESVCAPGDLLIAKVLSLNESLTILLTIEAADLGVIISRSRNFNIMSPTSSNRVRSPSSNREISKKLAILSKQ